MISTIFSRRSLLEFRKTFLWSIKKQLPFMILLTVLMFLVVPMVLMISAPQWVQQRTETMLRLSQETGVNAAAQESLQDYLSGNFTSFTNSYAPLAATVLTLIFAPILCVIQFGYMHKKRSVDFFHALPVGRVSMLLGRWCAGIAVLLLPLMLNSLIVSIVGASYGMATTVEAAQPWRQMLWCMLMGTAAFTSCIFFAVCSGTMFDTAISVIGVNAGYPLLLFCSLTITNMILPGFELGLRSNLNLLTAFAPFAAAFLPFVGERSAGFLLWWIFLSLVMLGGALFLYYRRKSETAEDNFAFRLPKYVIRFLVTGMCGLGFGLVLSSTGKNSFLIGVAAGSVIAHVIVQAVYTRGFRGMAKSFIGYTVFAAVFLAFYGVMATGMFGYDTRVPNADEVQSVSVSTGIVTENKGSLPGCTAYYAPAGPDEVRHELVPIITQKDNILTVLQAHRDIVSLYRSNGFPYQLKDTQGENFTLTYHLKNGGEMVRTYGYYDRNSNFVDPYHEICGKVTSLREYLENSDMIFYLEPEDIKSADIHSGNGENEKTVLPEGKQKQELMDALRQDYVDGEVNYSESGQKVNSTEPMFSIELNFMDNITPKNDKLKKLLGTDQEKVNIKMSGYYTFFRSDSQTMQLMKRYGWGN